MDNFNYPGLDFSGLLRAREQIIANSFLLGQQNAPDAFNRLQSYLPTNYRFDGGDNGVGAPVDTTPAPPSSGSRLAGVIDTSQVTLPKFNTRKLDGDAFYTALTSEVIGQPEIIKALTDFICLHVGKKKPSKPATALFMGPTGVGKTLLAETIPKVLTKQTGHDWGYIRVDLNQLTKSHDVSMLLGTSAGYVGYDDEVLFQPLLANKRTVLLFDEMEKGHPDVLRVLMNAMGNGRLEARKFIDGQREFDFRQTLMLFTSNIPLSIENPEEMTQAEITRECRRQLSEPNESGPTMPPEIAARFDEILLFKNLSDADKVEILGLTVIRTADQYDLNIRKIDPAFMQTVAERTSVERGAREAACEIGSILGKPLSAFADAHEGVKDIALSGTCEQVIVEPYAG